MFSMNFQYKNDFLITVAAWVRWDGGNNWQRIFDFGSDIEKSMFLTPSNGGGVIEWGIPSRSG